MARLCRRDVKGLKLGQQTGREDVPQRAELMRRPTGEGEPGLLWLNVATVQGVVGGGQGGRARDESGWRYRSVGRALAWHAQGSGFHP